MQYQVETFRRKSPFINAVRVTMRAARLAVRTESAYIHWICDFFAWTKFAKPDNVSSQQVTDYLSHLAVDRKVAAGTQNQAFCALLFLFRYVLKKDFGEINAKRAKVSANIPDYVTRAEVVELLKHLSGTARLLTLLGFGCGLRLMELLRLRVKDCDFGAGLIIVRDGKGGKNRVVPMPKSLVRPLALQILAVTATHKKDLDAGFGSVFLPGALALKYPTAAKDIKWQWVFPSPTICKDDDGTERRHHLFPTGFQKSLRIAGEKAKLNKRIHPHCLRHGYATALLEMGRSLEEVRERLGHKDITTTQIYLHCVSAANSPNPVDCLCEH